MTNAPKVPEKFLEILDKTGSTSKTGTITAVCDFQDGSASTAFFQASDDPNFYIWLAITDAMHPTALAAVNHPNHTAYVLLDSSLKLERLIVYSS
mgnify:CR=1 FL=1